MSEGKLYETIDIVERGKRNDALRLLDEAAKEYPIGVKFHYDGEVYGDDFSKLTATQLRKVLVAKNEWFKKWFGSEVKP